MIIFRNGQGGGGVGTTYRRPGFTLIELLVVVSIIALLAAILFPVFQRSRENARRSACSNNLRQIGLGILQYNQDFDEKYPYAGVEYPDPPGRLPEILMPYTKNTAVFRCPSDPKPGGSLSSYLATTSSPTFVTVYPLSYYYHFCFYHIFQDVTGQSPMQFGFPKVVSTAIVGSPAQKAMVDCVLSDNGLLDTTGKTYPPHREGFILSVYADGHVKNASFSNFSGNSSFGYKPYGSTNTVYYNFDWTAWGVQTVNGVGGKDLK